MILLPVAILLDALQHPLIRHPHPLQQARQVVHVKVPVRTPVRLPGPRRLLRQDLLAAVRTIPPAPPIRVTTDITVRVPHVVPVLLVKLIIRKLPEARPPEDQALLEAEAHALEEQRVLQPAKVLQVGVAAEGAVQVRHAGGVVPGEGVDVAGGDLGAGGEGAVGGVGAVRGYEVLGEVVENWGEAVVLVEAGESPRGELRELVLYLGIGCR